MKFLVADNKISHFFYYQINNILAYNFEFDIDTNFKLMLFKVMAAKFYKTFDNMIFFCYFHIGIIIFRKITVNNCYKTQRK